MPDLETLLQRLEDRGYKRTTPRRMLLAEIARRPGPFTAAEIYAALQSQDAGIGRATVFRTLDLLAEIGLVQRMHDEQSGGVSSAYLACEPVHHHHLICSSCHAVWDFVEGDLEASIAAVARRNAFQMRDHRLELYGVCAACREQPAAEQDILA
jgi:Fur family ferric uptake transcriptional regulator